MPLLSLLYRTVGAWGAGKGSRLTPAEVDENFYDIQAQVNALTDNPTLPAEIDDITVTDNAMTIHLSDGLTNFGPFQLPVAAMNWTDVFEPLHAYARGDLFTADGGLYFVNRAFTSEATFVAALGTGVGGVLPYASLMMVLPDKVRIGWFWPGKPGDGIDAGLLVSSDTPSMFVYLVTDTFYVPFDFENSVAKLRAPPTNDMNFGIARNNIQFGRLHFDAGDANGVFQFVDPDTGDPVESDAVPSVQFVSGDELTLWSPFSGVDDTAYGLSATIIGALGVGPEAASS